MPAVSFYAVGLAIHGRSSHRAANFEHVPRCLPGDGGNIGGRKLTLT